MDVSGFILRITLRVPDVYISINVHVSDERGDNAVWAGSAIPLEPPRKDGGL